MARHDSKCCKPLPISGASTGDRPRIAKTIDIILPIIGPLDLQVFNDGKGNHHTNRPPKPWIKRKKCNCMTDSANAQPIEPNTKILDPDKSSVYGQIYLTMGHKIADQTSSPRKKSLN